MGGIAIPPAAQERFVELAGHAVQFGFVSDANRSAANLHRALIS